MSFIAKIEDLINRALFWLGDKFAQLFHRLCPAFAKRAWARVVAFIASTLAWFKALPGNLKSSLAERKSLVKVDYKGVFAQALDAGQKAYNKTKASSPLKAALGALAAPFAFLFKWASSLQPLQFVVLFVFTTASVLSLLGIAITSKQMYQQETGADRTPASAEQVEYSRPNYYKKNEREVAFNNVKVPIYSEGVNELRALIIDFSVVASNRAAKRWLEKNEFELRDHLVLTLEPVLPTFPMTDEGRSMLTDKLKSEVNLFMQSRQVEGQVSEVRLVHILAH